MPSNWTDRSRKPTIPLPVYVLGGVIFVLGTSEFLIAGLLPQIASDLRVSIPAAGLLVSAFAVAMVVGAPLTAVATLRLPRRRTLVLALVLFTAGHVVSAVAASYGVLVGARIVTALATSLFWSVAGVVVVGMVDPAVRARALAFLVGGLTLANVAGVPLGTLLGQQAGWRAAFLGIGGLAVVAVVVVLAVVPGGAGTGTPAPLRRELAAFRRGRLWLAYLTIAAFQAAVMGTFSYLVPLLERVTGVPSALVPLLLFAFGAGSLVGVTAGGRFADGRPWTTLYVALGGVVGSLVLLWALPMVAPVAVVAVFTLGLSGFTCAAPLNARVFALSGAAPTLAGAASTSAFNVGNTVGPWAGGVTIAAGLGPAGPYTGPAFVATLLAVAALGLGLLSRSLDRRSARAPEPEPFPAEPVSSCSGCVTGKAEA